MHRWLARRRTALLGALLAVSAAMAGAALPARAQPAGLHPDRYAAVVLEARTGQVLFAADADDTRHPASLTKMMTLYLMFEALRDGRIELSTPIRFSAEAASRPPSKLGVPPGGAISAESAILALVTRSANDVAAAVAEHLAGSEGNFARVMTQRARQIGMTRTTFRNASGLPDWEQVTTARDMATLGRRLIADHPRHYHYFSATHFSHGGRLIRNHNGMLLNYEGADGIKTGFINASGFNIVTSAQRDNVRLVGAVFGGTSYIGRNRHMAQILDDGFERMGVRARTAAVAALPRVLAAREPDLPPGLPPGLSGFARPAALATAARAPARGGARPAVAQARTAAAARRTTAASAPAAAGARRHASGARGAREVSPLVRVSQPAAARPARAAPAVAAPRAQPPRAQPPRAQPPRAEPPRATPVPRPAATRSAEAAPRPPRG